MQHARAETEINDFSELRQHVLQMQQQMQQQDAALQQLIVKQAPEQAIVSDRKEFSKPWPHVGGGSV